MEAVNTTSANTTSTAKAAVKKNESANRGKRILATIPDYKPGDSAGLRSYFTYNHECTFTEEVNPSSWQASTFMMAYHIDHTEMDPNNVMKHWTNIKTALKDTKENKPCVPTP
jgi:hypothetical protein